MGNFLKKYSLVLLTLVSMGLPHVAFANYLLENSLNFSQFNLGPATKRGHSFTFTKLGIYVSRSKDSDFFWGGGVSYLSQAYGGDAPESITAVDYNLGFRWCLNQKQTLWLGASISPLAKADFQLSTGKKETWSGYSAVASLEYLYPSNSNFSMGLSLDYYSAKYTKLTSATQSSDSSQSNNAFIPAILFALNW